MFRSSQQILIAAACCVAIAACTVSGPPAAVSDRCEPVVMIVSGVTLDRERMRAYSRQLAESGLYDHTGGYYVNDPRPIAVFEGDPPDDHVALVVRFPSIEAARAFWYDPDYQERIKPMRLNPAAGDYDVIVYREVDVPARMRGRVRDATYDVGEMGCDN